MTYNLKMYYFVRFYNNSYPNLFNFLILLISLSIFSVYVFSSILQWVFLWSLTYSHYSTK